MNFSISIKIIKIIDYAKHSFTLVDKAKEANTQYRMPGVLYKPEENTTFYTLF